MRMRSGTFIEQEVNIGTTMFLVVVMKFGNIHSYLVLNEDGQTVEITPFRPYIEAMIEELSQTEECQP
jgi:hypothetical protein